MFSGIVEEMATVVAIRHDKENIDFTLKCSFVDELGIDQSVAHNGVCLTVVEIKDGTYTVTAMKETLDRSNLGLLKVGDKVNVERSMVMNGRLDGHSQRTHHAYAFELLFGSIFAAHGNQAGHFMLGNLDLLAAPFGQRHVGNLIGKSVVNIHSSMFLSYRIVRPYLPG